MLAKPTRHPTKTHEVDSSEADSGLRIHVRKQGDRADTDEVTIAHEQTIGDDRVLKVLIEKDFQCLVPQDDEDQSDPDLTGSHFRRGQRFTLRPRRQVSFCRRRSRRRESATRPGSTPSTRSTRR